MAEAEIKNEQASATQDDSAQKAMMASSTYQTVKAIIVDKLGVDEAKILPNARFREDLNADSLDLVELIMDFEEKFKGEISDEEAQKITTVGEAVTFLDSQKKAAA